MTQEKRKLLSQDNLPHWAMLVMFVTWLYLQITLGTDGVPGSFNEAFAAVSGMWFTYLMHDLDNKKEKPK